MRDATNIQLDQLIVHILDTKQPDSFVLSECIIPLDGNQRLVDYFIGHIQNSLKDTTAKAARFVAIDNEIVSGICKALLQDRLSLVEGSRKLAQQLYEIIAKDKRINSCDLAVCFYRAEKQNRVSRYLALLNIEPSEVFRHTKEHDSQGKLYVNFKIETEVMPTTGEKLQKCAFIQQLEPRPEYDMMILDRQKQGKEVAKFFIKDFMGATPALDARQRTDNLYNGLISAHNQIRPELQPDENESLYQAIQVAIKSDNINLDTWVKALPLSEKHKQQIEQVVSLKLPDREFEIDKTYAQSLIHKRVFHGDYGLKVVIEASEEKYKKVIKSEKRIEKPGTPPYYCIEIHTEKWDEVP
jgi:nucleoid-associated protein YejK